MIELLKKKSISDIFQKYYDEYDTTTPEFTILRSIADDGTTPKFCNNCGSPMINGA